MESLYSVKLGKLIQEFRLEVLRGGAGYEDVSIRTEDVNRPGLQLTGFFDYFDAKRLQVIGRVETTYLEGLTSEERRESFELLLSQDIPALIISREIEPFPECMEMAEKYDRTILRSPDTTSVLMSNIIAALKSYLAPRITRHGVLVEVYGEGVLLLGESGVGKSETAIELVKRGHRLIADDAVEIKRNVTDRLVGTAPELIRHYIELRGIGVIDVRRLKKIEKYSGLSYLRLNEISLIGRNVVVSSRLASLSFSSCMYWAGDVPVNSLNAFRNPE